MIKKIYMLLFAAILSVACQDESKQLEYFPLSQVELLDSPFRHAQELNKEYLLALDPDRLLAPYLREAGLPPKAESYTNWENTGLDGHIGGHYLSALSYMYASTADPRIGERLDYMLSELERVQQANGNGYIGGVPDSKTVWDQIARGDIQAAPFSLNGKWVPLYNIHKMYAGLRDAGLQAGRENALRMLTALTDWMIGITAGLTDEQMQDMLRSEHGGLNETFADVAMITGEEKYLDLAKRFSHLEILTPLLEGRDQLTGLHANTQIPKVLGYKRVADAGGDPHWHDAARFFWETVTENRSVSIGGNSVNEHFNPVEDFMRVASSEQGPETCNSYNMLRLTGMLYASEPDSRYFDYYEKTLYNHILSTQNPHTGGLVYFTPMRPAHYRVYSQPQTSMWCCVGSGMENHSKYGEMIYAHQGKTLYVNLFIPSQLDWKEQGIEIIQTNRFPEEPSTRLTVNPGNTATFELKIRCPEWTDRPVLSVNGESVAVQKDAQGYLSLKRNWKPGDEIILEMPMRLRAESFPDRSDFRTLVYGPLVLASAWSKDGLDGLFADDSRGGHIAHGPKVPFSEIPVVSPDETILLSGITPKPGQALHFTLHTPSGEEFELEPFYGLHESRYVIYWPTLKFEMNSEAWDEVTLDMVYCGQQQPESDHAVSFGHSTTGYTRHVHWRSAEDWFAYRLKNKDASARFLLVKHINTGEKGQASISANGKIVKNIGSGSREGEVVQTLVHLTEDVRAEEIEITVKATREGTPTPKFTEFRLLSRTVIED